MPRSFVFFVVVVLAWPPALRAEKLPAPSDDDLKGSLALIKELYGEEHANAKTNEQLQALAKKLFSIAEEVDDPVKRFALLRASRDIAAQGRDGQTAFQIIEELNKQFQVDAVRMKASVLYSLSKEVRLSTDRKSIADEALVLVDQAASRDDFELAGNLIEMALSEAKKIRDAAFVRKITARQEKIERLSSAYSEVREAVRRLDETPTDPDANLFVGKYQCLVKGDWEYGLPMLALGSDADLKAIALKELNQVTKPEEQVDLGNAWWRLAGTDDTPEQSAMRRRAVHWYRRVMRVADGLVRAQASKRFHEFYAETIDTRSDAILLLGCDQKTVKQRGKNVYAADGSGMANHGIVHGAVLSREGKVGECFEFDGTGNSIEFPTLHKAL